MATYFFTSKKLLLPEKKQVKEYSGDSDEIVFNHSGNMGDILYSLYFVSEFLSCKKIRTADFNIRVNQYVQYPHEHPNGNVLMSEKAADFVKPLIEMLNIFNKVSALSELPDNVFDLDKFRKLPLNINGGDIRNWYYNLCAEHLPHDFSKALFVPEKNDSLKSKVILIRTPRYVNVLADFDFLKKYRDKLVFMGMPEEHGYFCKNFFDIDYCRVSDAKEAAELMAGAQGVIGNPSGLYSIAECLKVPRVLLTPEYMRFGNGQIVQGAVNVHPRGGWFEIAQTAEKFKSAVDNLMNI